MTMKAKRRLAIGGGTALCAALAVLIATRFAPDDSQLTTNSPPTESKPAVSVEISTAKHDETKPIEAEKPMNNTAAEPENAPAESDPEKEAADFIKGGGIEIEQNFPEPERANEPPAPPQIEDEEMLTNPDKEPTYEPEPTAIKPQTGTPKHGDKKDGMIYINGFGWVADEGGGGVGYTDNEMYQNGNKIGYFG